MAANQSILPFGVLVIATFVHYAATYDALEMLRHALRDGMRSFDIRAEDSKIITFWMNPDRRNPYRIDRCSVDNLRYLQGRIELDMQSTQMTNVWRLYNFAEFNLLTSCGIKMDGIAEHVIHSIGPERIRRMEVAVREFDLWFSRGTHGSFQSVAESMMVLLGLDRDVDRVELINAWNESPCPKVLHIANDARMVPLSNYARMLTETKIYPLYLGDEVNLSVINAVSIVRYCEHFRSVEAQIEVWKTLQTDDFHRKIFYQGLRDELMRSRNLRARVHK